MIRRSCLLPSAFCLLFLSAAVPAFAQQRPLQTEDPEVIGAGRMMFEAGVDYKRDVFFPLSGLRGNLFTVPPFGFSVGVSSIAEIQIDGGIYQKLFITEQSPDAPFSDQLTLDSVSTADVEDFNLGAKIRFLSETAGRPSMAVRFSTRLPNASNERGLGKDMQDFTVSLIAGKTVQSIRVVLNVGLLILGNPTKPAAQDDLLVYSLSVARAISAGGEVVGEFAGRANFANIVTPGAEDRGLMRFGMRYTIAGVRFDGGVLLGLTSRDPKIGFTTGFTWVFNAFSVP
jgi:hypothetical protein